MQIGNKTHLETEVSLENLEKWEIKYLPLRGTTVCVYYV